MGQGTGFGSRRIRDSHLACAVVKSVSRETGLKRKGQAQRLSRERSAGFEEAASEAATPREAQRTKVYRSAAKVLSRIDLASHLRAMCHRMDTSGSAAGRYGDARTRGLVYRRELCLPPTTRQPKSPLYIERSFSHSIYRDHSTTSTAWRPATSKVCQPPSPFVSENP